MTADWFTPRLSASWSSPSSWNMSPSCSALHSMMNLLTAFLFSSSFSSFGPVASSSSRLSSKYWATSPSDSEQSPRPSSEVLVSGMARGPPSWLSPRHTHFAIRASRRARLSASLRSTSSSVSPCAKAPPATSSPLLSATSISSRQAGLRTCASCRFLASASLRAVSLSPSWVSTASRALSPRPRLASRPLSRLEGGALRSSLSSRCSLCSRSR
mmetsp:Transcript_85822/g.243340  ORF Transcript_85822/g.243340 Transcript_85822/m.243340 type:complete len:214 (+) Transcript_85822:1259-1900(+)